MCRLDNLYGKSKETKKQLCKFDDRWSMKCYLQVDKFLLDRSNMCQLFK